MTVMIVINVMQDHLYPGLDAVKREIGMAGAALFYTMVGADRWCLRALGSTSSPAEQMKEAVLG